MKAILILSTIVGSYQVKYLPLGFREFLTLFWFVPEIVNGLFENV